MSEVFVLSRERKESTERKEKNSSFFCFSPKQQHFHFRAAGQKVKRREPHNNTKEEEVLEEFIKEEFIKDKEDETEQRRRGV